MASNENGGQSIMGGRSYNAPRAMMASHMAGSERHICNTVPRQKIESSTPDKAGAARWK
jgi:hypothetical protein